MSPFALLAATMDILRGRADGSDRTAWAEERGFAGFLLGLDDEELARCEELGLSCMASDPRMPASLRELCADVFDATRVPCVAVDSPLPVLGHDDITGVRARKRTQMPALLASVEQMASHARRIVDFGSGSGHFTRLAADRFDREALGIERDAARVEAASRWASSLSPDRSVRFVQRDVGDSNLDLLPTDLAVGLHACGDLGDRLTLAAADAGADLALVSCCPQKIAATVREPLSMEARAFGFRIPRDVLGLANLSQQKVGVEVSLETSLAARQARVGLRVLLEARGIPLAEGEEMRGINRRRARAGLDVIAGLALAHRGCPAPTAAELEAASSEAERRSAVARRLTLPRSLLARLLEIALVKDRSAAIEERGHGHGTLVATVFDRTATPRNLGLFASKGAARLPRVLA